MTNALNSVLGAASEELARRDLLAFARRVYPRFEAPPHIAYIAGRLERLSNGEGKNLCLSVPVRHGKSVLCSQVFPTWHIGRHPTDQVIIASHSESLAVMHSRVAKHLVEDDRWPFPDVKLSSDSASIQRWNVTASGGCYAIGVGGSITGRGFQIGVIDDALHDALSESESESCWNWFREIFTPRADPGAKLVVVGARLSTTDLIGRIAESDFADSFEFVRFPALAEENDPLGRSPGEALWPKRMSVAEIEERRAMMVAHSFEAQFQQDPRGGGIGNVFERSWFKLYQQLPTPRPLPPNPLDRFFENPLNEARERPDALVVVTACDAAAKQTSDGSYSALVTVVSDGSNVYLAEVERFREDFSGLRAKVVAHVARWNSDLLLIEDAAMGSTLLGDLQASSSLPVRPVSPTRSKVERAFDVLPMCEGGRVYLPARAPWKEEFERELFSFPNSRYDDCVDSFVHALSYIDKVDRMKRNAQFWDRQIENLADGFFAR